MIPMLLGPQPRAKRTSRRSSQSDTSGRSGDLARNRTHVTAQHDSALSEVVRYYRSSNKKCFALTTDRTMGALAARWQGPSGTPSWILLDALVQVLAADRAGLAEDQVDFSTLLSKLIANEVGPVANEFRIRDLLWLSEIVEKVEAFPDEVVNDLARIVHRKRLAGAPRDDPELRLTLERTIQQARDELIMDRDNARQDVARATEHANEAGTRRKRLRHALVEGFEKDLIRRARRALLFRSGVALLVATPVVLGARTLVLWALPDLDSRADLLAVGLGIAGILASLSVAAGKWIWPRYREARDAASDEAERQARSVEG